MFDFAETTQPKTTLKQINQQWQCKCGQGGGIVDGVRISHATARSLGLTRSKANSSNYSITHQYDVCALCEPSLEL